MKANRNCYFYVKQSHCISLPYIVFQGSVSGLQIPKFWVHIAELFSLFVNKRGIYLEKGEHSLMTLLTSY